MNQDHSRASVKVFISYRREDTGGDAGRLSDTLKQFLGADRTFLDLDQIALGKNFEVELKRVLSLSTVLLALIGPKWETVTGADDRPRVSDNQDYVRMELLMALRNENITVVPVLINRDSLPAEADLPHSLRPILKLQAFQMRRNRWTDDVAALLLRLGIPQQNSRAVDQARMVSAVVEWKRKNDPDPRPRRWVVYVDNNSDAPITVERVTVFSPSSHLAIDWGSVRPKEVSDYELDEEQFEPSGDRPELRVQFRDSYGQMWSLSRGVLTERNR